MKTKIIPYLEPNDVVIFCGPTASGKSALAFETAKECNGEIVSIDSMQLYKGLEIGTAQATKEEKDEVIHHLVGCFDIEKRVDVTSFVQLAQKAIEDIQSRNKVAILAGGTGLYLRTLLYGMDDIPSSRELREELDKKYDFDEAMEELQEKMRIFDPLAFEKYQNCRRRLIRALEVKTLTGKSIIELQSSIKRECKYNVKSFSIQLETDVLKERILKRARIMLENGWIDEAKLAIENGLFSTPTAHQALGYKQINEYLQGKISYDKLIEKISTATWQFARRQRTWFKHQHPEANKYP